MFTITNTESTLEKDLFMASINSDGGASWPVWNDYSKENLLQCPHVHWIIALTQTFTEPVLQISDNIDKLTWSYDMHHHPSPS